LGSGRARTVSDMLPLLSVVIPCHNHAWSIGRTLKSVSAQRYDWVEVIVVDDGSTDLSAKVVEQHQRDDARIRLVQQAQQGLAAARNRGIAEAKGEYVAPIDADDLWHPDNLTKQVAALERSGASLSYAFSVRVDVDDLLLPSKRPVSRTQLDFATLLRDNLIGNGSAAVFRRRALESIGGYDESLRQRDAEGAEDWKATLLLTAEVPAVVVPEYLVAYRISASSMSRSDPLRQLRATLAVLDDVRYAVPNLPESAYRGARTRSILRQMPDCLPHCDTSTVAHLLMLAYLRNPLWFSEPAALKFPLKLVWKASLARLLQAHRDKKHRLAGQREGISFSGESFRH
jgi:glycosyltransferase involved in cell wall biosynthesis